MDRTFVVVKPDGVKRGLIGECVGRLEKAGLKLVAMKMVQPTAELVIKHYPSSDVWFRKVGDRSIKTFKENSMDVKAKFGTEDAIEIGKIIKSWIVKFWTSGPVVAMIWEGNRAIDQVRRLVGETDPILAMPGSIRGDFSIDNVINGNRLGRPIANVIHASGDAGEAKNEIALWFTDKEVMDYKRYDEEAFYKQW